MYNRCAASRRSVRSRRGSDEGVAQLARTPLEVVDDARHGWMIYRGDPTAVAVFAYFRLDPPRQAPMGPNRGDEQPHPAPRLAHPPDTDGQNASARPHP